MNGLFANKLKDDREGIITLLTTRAEDGTAYYAFVQTSEILFRKFQIACQNKAPVIFRDYGTILLEGKGEPSEAEHRFIREKFSNN